MKKQAFSLDWTEMRLTGKRVKLFFDVEDEANAFGVEPQRRRTKRGQLRKME